MSDGTRTNTARARARSPRSFRLCLKKVHSYAATLILALLATFPLCAAISAQILESSFQVERVGHTATLLPDGRVLIAGGANRSGALSAAEIFDPATGAFSAARSVVAPRTDHAAVLDAQMAAPHAYYGAILLPDGTMFIARGLALPGNSPGIPDNWDLSRAEVFNPATLSFSSASAMQASRIAPMLRALPDGKSQAMGGTDNGEVEI